MRATAERGSEPRSPEEQNATEKVSLRWCCVGVGVNPNNVTRARRVIRLVDTRHRRAECHRKGEFTLVLRRYRYHQGSG